VIYNNRKLENKSENSNGTTGPMPMKDRKRLEPINAFEAEEGQLTYATIVPVTKTTDDENSSSSNQPPQPVIYAELAATQPPVVNADNNA